MDNAVKQTRTIRGEVTIPNLQLASDNGELILRVEDTSRADAPATVVAEQRFPGVALRPGAVIPFHLEVPVEQLNERGMYSVRVHVNFSGSGQVEKGDLLSTQTYPVLTRGYRDQVQVTLKQV